MSYFTYTIRRYNSMLDKNRIHLTLIVQYRYRRFTSCYNNIYIDFDIAKLKINNKRDRK